MRDNLVALLPQDLEYTDIFRNIDSWFQENHLGECS